MFLFGIGFITFTKSFYPRVVYGYMGQALTLFSTQHKQLIFTKTSLLNFMYTYIVSPNR